MEEILEVINEADLWKVHRLTTFWSIYELYLFWTYIKHTILIKVDLISRKMWALERTGQETACPLRCKHAAVVQLLSCVWLCHPIDCNMPGFPILHYLPEFSLFLCPLSQWCYLTISSSTTLFSSYPQSFPASGCFPMNQLFLYQVVKILELQLQYQSSQWIFRLDFL